MLNLQSIDHVTLIVTDLKAVKRYYEELFGFSITEIFHKESKHLQLEIGTVRFFFTEDPTVSTEMIRQQHISFAAESLAPVIALLEARGEAYTTGTYHGFKTNNYHWCEWRDPAGIRVECVEHIADLS
ncbi:MAG: VOC family protein [Chloroflexota bacterium]